jgi:SAM-dependent methyltransferase
MNLYRSIQHGWRRLPERYRSRLHAAPVFKDGMAWMKGHYASHDELYDAPYFEALDRQARISAPAIAESIVEDFSPACVLDVGCGTGALLMELRARGVMADGLEYSEAALSLCESRGLTVRRLDLEQTIPRDLGCGYDVVVSMEVAEHLPAKIADRFVALLARSERTVVFTAAVPGQGGSDHVNEQPHAYWIAKFADHGFRHDGERSERWRVRWRDRTVSWYYTQNVMIFVKVADAT